MSEPTRVHQVDENGIPYGIPQTGGRPEVISYGGATEAKQDSILSALNGVDDFIWTSDTVGDWLQATDGAADVAEGVINYAAPLAVPLALKVWQPPTNAGQKPYLTVDVIPEGGVAPYGIYWMVGGCDVLPAGGGPWALADWMKVISGWVTPQRLLSSDPADMSAQSEWQMNRWLYYVFFSISEVLVPGGTIRVRFRVTDLRDNLVLSS